MYLRVTSRNQPLLPGINRSLCAIHHVELTQDIADMTLDRLFANDQFTGNFGIGESIRDQAQYL